ncbi:MAG: hypothetical protein ACK4UJ_09995 [Leptonema sp. (in: bacteria)]
MRQSPEIHQVVNLFSVTGYSNSILVRFLMEWECLDGVSMKENRLDAGTSETTVIVITEVAEVRIHHRYQIINEIVEEQLISEFG